MATSANLAHYQKNKERIKAYAHNDYHNNKGIIKQKRNNYTQEQKDRISNYHKEKRNNRSEQEIINTREYARNWYRNLPEEIKNKKREYQHNRYHTIIKAH